MESVRVLVPIITMGIKMSLQSDIMGTHITFVKKHCSPHKVNYTVFGLNSVLFRIQQVVVTVKVRVKLHNTSQIMTQPSQIWDIRN